MTRKAQRRSGTHRQRTIARSVVVEGAGLHTGKPATVSLHSAAPDSGLLFRRIDLPGMPEIPANLDHVVATDRCTALGRGDVQLLTVEHLLAALGAAGISNVRVDVSGPELPIRDGSFLDYLDTLEEAGAVEQDASVQAVRLDRPVVFRASGGESYILSPGPGFHITATIDFDHPAIGRQTGSFGLSIGDFRTGIAPARTFGFLSEVEELRARGLALGADLENTVVLDEDGVMEGALRFPDEFLRHKVGDLLGDLTLLGSRLQGHVVVERPGHWANIEFARTLLRESGAAPGFGIERIRRYLPHRYPMLLVDRVVRVEGNRRIVGLKNVSIDEPFFRGHFPGHPIMPGVLIVEAMAQVGGLLLIDLAGDERADDASDRKVYLMSIQKARFRRPVLPGDQLVCEVELLQFRRGVCKMRGEGFVGGVMVAEAQFMAKVVDG